MAENSVSDLERAMSDVFMGILDEIHTCLPGQVEKYDYKKQKAEVKPLIKKELFNGELISMNPIAEVPVIFPGTKNGIIHFPLNRGDGVLLIFAERSISAWLSSGRDSAPIDNRRFNLTDCIAIAGLNSFKGNSIAKNNDDFIIKYKNGTIEIKKNGQIDINNGNLTVDL